MIICNQENLTALLTSCEKGETKVAAIVSRETDLLESNRDTFVEYFMGDGIDGVESVKQVLNVDGVGEVDCLVFKSGSLVFLYALPGERSIPHAHSMICSQTDPLFESAAISEAAFQLGISEELRKAIASRLPTVPATVEEPKKRRTRKKEPEVDPLDEWINSLKVIN